MIAKFSLLLLPFVLAVSNAMTLLGGVEDVGELRTANLSKVEQQQMKLFVGRAVKQLNYESDTPFYWKIDRVLKIKKQLVAGLKYEFDVLIARSDCLKESDQERIASHACAIPEDSPREVCEFVGFVNFVDGIETYTNNGCRPQRRQSISPSKQVEQRMRKIMEKARQSLGASNAETWSLFSAFVERYSKNYDTTQEAIDRFQVYKRNLRRAKLFQDNELGTAAYGETKFMDMSAEEFQQIYLPYKWEQPNYYVNQLDEFSPHFEMDESSLPSSIDWREKHAVTDVKNQESCGSCWAFSVTGNIEGQWALKSGELISLSEQELLDCDIIDEGCNGGLPLNAYKEIIRMGGLEPEKDYPYDAHREKCHLVRKEIAVYINDSVQMPKDESKMAIWLFKNGPLSIGINAYPLQFYRHGISHPWKIFCSPMMLNHGVLIVGYGTEGSKPFWIIKNSWGTSWGESGYYRLYRGKNVCGVSEMATSSIIN